MSTGATTMHHRSSLARVAYGLAAAILLAAVVAELAAHGGGWWQVAVFGLGPDVALVYGTAPGLEKGQLHPRAVVPYNLLHRLWGPVVLTVLAATGVLPGLLVGGLTWGLHVTLDRAIGYGLRTPDGFQRA